MAVKIDGVLESLHEVRGGGHGSQVFLELGPWEPADADWHAVEVVLDPLNLFKETDESNNRISTMLRIVQPDLVLDAAMSGFTIPYDSGGDGFTLVSEVFEGFPVDARLRMEYGGPYEGVVRSIRTGTTVIAIDTVRLASCSDVTYFSNNLVARWLPPAAGIYNLEMRVDALGPVGDPNPLNNVVTKQLLVRPTGTGERGAGSRGRTR